MFSPCLTLQGSKSYAELGDDESQTGDGDAGSDPRQKCALVGDMFEFSLPVADKSLCTAIVYF